MYFPNRTKKNKDLTDDYFKSQVDKQIQRFGNENAFAKKTDNGRKYIFTIHQITVLESERLKKKSNEDKQNYFKAVDYGYAYEPWHKDSKYHNIGYIVDPCKNVFKFVKNGHDKSSMKIIIPMNKSNNHFCDDFEQFLSHPLNKHKVGDYRFPSLDDKIDDDDITAELSSNIKKVIDSESGNIFLIKPATSEGLYYIFHVDGAPASQLLIDLTNERYEVTADNHKLQMFTFQYYNTYPQVYQNYLNEIAAEAAAKKKEEKMKRDARITKHLSTFTDYEKEEEEKKRKKQKKEKEQEQQKTIIYSGVGLLTLMIFLIVYVKMKQSK